MAAVERTDARRVVIDSLADLRMAAPDETRFREFVYSPSASTAKNTATRPPRIMASAPSR